MRQQLSLQHQSSMTLSLAKALQVLAMPQLELSEFLIAEIEKNPILELDSYPPNYPFLNNISSSPSFHEHMMAQIREHFLSVAERIEAISLYEMLDENGFLPNPPSSPVLSILKTFHPRGIFAKDLQESLMLQLDSQSLAYKIVRDCFQELLQKKFHIIKKKTKIQDISSAIHSLLKLNFRPKDLFKQDYNPPIIPDLSFSKIAKTWILQIKENKLPKFHLHANYLTLQDPIVKQWNSRAQWLFRTLKRRKQILLEIGTFFIRKQKDFLEGSGPLKPLSLKHLSNILNLHESTLSRALANKFVVTPRGILPLRSFLSQPSANVKRALHLLFQHETKPLTDMEIVQVLKERGIKIARRTVTKYRAAANIPQASLRKLQISQR